MRSRRSASAVFLCLLVAAPAVHAKSPEGWNATVSPYVWLPGISGTATIGPRRLNAPAAVFSDVLAQLNFAMMGSAEIRHGRFGLLADLLYLDISKDVDTPADRLHVGGSGSIRALGLGFAALYRVVDTPQGMVDLGAGLRPWWIDTGLKLNPGTQPAQSASASVGWIDPIIAIHGSVKLSQQFSLSGYGDIGGFGVGSELTYQLLATVDWRPKDWLALHAG